MTLSDKQHAFAKDFARLLSFLIENGVKFTLGEGHRPQILQDIYFSEGASWTKHSLHTQKLAHDINFFLDGQYIGNMKPEEAKKRLQFIGDFWTSLSPENRWGGNHNPRQLDVPHFERRP